MATASPQELFDLAPEELVVPLRVISPTAPPSGTRPLRVTHFFRAPALDDWLAYDRALKLTIREPAAASDEAAIFHSQAAEAAALLWRRLIRRIEGYRAAGAASSELGAGERNWTELVPLEHKQQAVRALALIEVDSAGQNEDELYPLDIESREIRLRVHRNGRWFAGLIHRFRRPTTEDELAYRRILSELYVLRGSGETRVPPRLGALVRLYDRLILFVEGYARAGVPLDGATGSDARNLLVATMDALHKRMAVEALFGELSTLEAEAEPAQIDSGE